MKTLFLSFILMGGFLFLSSCNWEEGEGEPPIPCYYAQSHWFGDNASSWAPLSSVYIGGRTYSRAQSEAIWDCSTGSPVPKSKVAFWTLASLELSGIYYTTGDPAVDSAAEYLDDVLSQMPRLRCSYLPQISDPEFITALEIVHSWTYENGCADEPQ